MVGLQHASKLSSRLVAPLRGRAPNRLFASGVALFAPVLQEKNDGNNHISPRNGSSDTSFLRLQDRIGYLFNNPNLLERALTHPSSHLARQLDNERMGVPPAIPS